MKKLISFSVVMHFLLSLITAQTYFEEVASQKGINHLFNSTIPGIGVSFCDFNQDGLDDLTMATANGEFLKFYVNQGGTFEEIEPLVEHQEHAKAVLWVDYDNDGDKDLYVSSFGSLDHLYQNQGDLTFVDVTFTATLSYDYQRTFGACWADYDRDGLLDLYYSERKFPLGVAPNENRLFRNKGNGTFEEMTNESGARDPGKTPFCAGFHDFNNDKWPDIYIANDKATINAMLRNNGDGTFTEVGEATNTNAAIHAMCVAVGDYDNDGWQDIYSTNIEFGNILLHNLGSENDEDPVFEEVADATGTAFYGISWGANFLDANNDGWLDLYVSGSTPGTEFPTAAYYENQMDGTFIEPAAGFEGDTVRSYSNAIGDFNNDGFPDIIVTNEAPYKAQLWENGGGEANWIKVKLEGVLSNRDAIGSRIEVYAGEDYYQRFTHCGIGFLGQNSSTEIIGIGDHAIVDSIVVTWPTGHIDKLTGLSPNTLYEVLEGSTTFGNIYVDPELGIMSSTSQPTRTELLELYPNPTNEIVQLKVEAIDYNRCQIIDLNGKILFDQDFSHQVSVQHLPKGIYFFIAFAKNGQRRIAKFEKI